MAAQFGFLAPEFPEVHNLASRAEAVARYMSGRSG